MIGVTIASFFDSKSRPCCKETLHMVQMNGINSSRNSRRIDVGRRSGEQDFGGDRMRSFRTSSIDQGWKKVKDASVSLVKVGASAVEVSSRTALILSWKNPDSVSAEMSDVEGGVARSFRWRSLSTDHSFLEFPVFEVILLVQKLSSFRSSRFRFRSICRIHAMQSIFERVCLYRLSHILTFCFAFLLSLSYHGVSGRSLTEMFSTGWCSSTIRRKVLSYKSKRAADDIVENASALSHSCEFNRDCLNESLFRRFQNRMFFDLRRTAKFTGGKAQKVRPWSD